MSIYVVTDEKTGEDYYSRDDRVELIPEGVTCKKYATITDAIKDSCVWHNDHYSDGECLDYIMHAIAQLEENE